MPLEVATFISDLVTTNPATSDQVSQGDDHIRQLKSTLQNTFPGADRALPFPDTESKTANFSVVSGDFNKTFLVDSSGVGTRLTSTLPTLTSDDKGWKCHFIKTDTSTRPILIAPASGTLQSGPVSGLSSTRRCIPGVRFTAHWTGALWFITRCIDVPVASVIEYDGASLPVGFEWPDGTALSGVANYPDYNSVRGGLSTIDRRACVAVAKDNMGGSAGAASKMTSASTSFGANPNTLGAIGGDDNTTMLPANLALHKHNITDKEHDHVMRVKDASATAGIPNLNRSIARSVGGDIYITEAPDTDLREGTVKGAMTGITETENGGEATPTPMSRVQFSVVKNFLLVVE